MRSRVGQSLVELAITAPLLILILIGTFDGAELLISKDVVAGAARAGARVASLAGGSTTPAANQLVVDGQTIQAVLGTASSVLGLIQEVDIYQPRSADGTYQAGDLVDRFDTSGKQIGALGYPLSARIQTTPTEAWVGVQVVWAYHPVLSPAGAWAQQTEHAVAKMSSATLSSTASIPSVGPAPVASGLKWSQLKPASSPSLRVYPSVAYDSALGDVILFGGNTSSGLANDTWEWNGTTWIRLSPAHAPTPRMGALLAYDSGHARLLLFGGWSTAPYLANDLWAFDGSDWTQLHPATSPTPRQMNLYGAYDSGRQRLVVFGGQTSSGLQNDTWEFDGSNWVQIHTPSSPPPVAEGGMAYDAAARQLVLFGGDDTGTTTGNFIDDTWTYDGSTWSQHDPAGSPAPRVGPLMAYDSSHHRVVMFGGYFGSRNTTVQWGDTWTWDGTSWTNVSALPSPPPEFQGGMDYDSAVGGVVLLTGFNGSLGVRGQTWLGTLS